MNGDAFWTHLADDLIRDYMEKSGIESGYVLQKPTRSENDVLALGVDLNAPYQVVIPPFSSAVVNSFVKFVFPFPVTAWPRGRSSFLIGSGVFEESYVGPVYVRVVNYMDDFLVLEVGDPLCQLIPQATSLRWGSLTYVSSIEAKTRRGELGGITGVSVDDGAI